MKQTKHDLVRYCILFILLGIGVWQIQLGNSNYGSGLVGVAVFIFIVSLIKQMGTRKDQEQGINPLDERTWAIAGRAAYRTYVTYALLLASIVIFGSIGGPQVMVNPYNLLGFCLAGIVLLYVVFFYYYNHKY